MNTSAKRENKALEKASSPPKAAGTLPTPTITEARSSTTTTKVAKASVQEGKGKASASKEKKKGEKQEKSKEEPGGIVAIESAVESDVELVIDEEAEDANEQRAGT